MVHPGAWTRSGTETGSRHRQSTCRSHHTTTGIRSSPLFPVTVKMFSHKQGPCTASIDLQNRGWPPSPDFLCGEPLTIAMSLTKFKGGRLNDALHRGRRHLRERYRYFRVVVADKRSWRRHSTSAIWQMLSVTLLVELIPVYIKQAFIPPVTIRHPPGGRLPLLSARPAVIFSAADHHRPLAGTKRVWNKIK